MKRINRRLWTRTLFSSVAIPAMVALLFGCGGTSLSQSEGTPTLVRVPATVLPSVDPTKTTAATALPQVTAAIAPTATEAPLKYTYGAKPNDATQARLRVGQCVFPGLDMDVYIDGQVPVEAGIPLSHVGFVGTRYEYLQPGTHKVAVVPTGKGIDEAVLSPMDVQLVAGHRYTVFVLGQIKDTTHKGLVVDETQAYQTVGAKPTDIANIVVNNIKGVQGIDYTLSGVLSHSNVPYGGFKADIWPASWTRGDVVSVTGAHDKVLVQEDFPSFNMPGVDSVDCWGGSYPGSIGTDYDNIEAPPTSSLNPVDFLQAFTDESARNGGKTPSFNTFLTAVKTAGLTDMLAHGGPYLVFPPNDEAFARLPKDQLNALMADPKALADLVRGHMVDGYYPPLTLVNGFYQGYFDRTVTNMLGERLALYSSNGGLFVNDQPIGSLGDVSVANGTRVFFDIGVVTMPPAK